MNAKAVKMNITVPNDLREQMNRTGGVNWSAVACDAFRAKLANITNEIGMSYVVERLRASKEASQAVPLEDGMTWGRKWAQDTASYEQLRRLFAAYDRCEAIWEWEYYFMSDAMFKNDPLCSLYRLIHGETVKPREAIAYWKDVGVEDPRNHDGVWYQGFAEGAIEVFEDIREQL